MDENPLQPIRDVGFGEDESFTGNPHDPLVRSAASGSWQPRRRSGDVRADHGEVPAFQFPNVRASLTGVGSGSVCMRIGADAFDKIHGAYLTIVRCPVKRVHRYFPSVESDKAQHVVCSRVARILRQEREKRGLSMNRVAERAGLSQQTVSYVEREMRNPTLETLLRIAAAIEVNLADVLAQALKETRKLAPKRKS